MELGTSSGSHANNKYYNLLYLINLFEGMVISLELTEKFNSSTLVSLGMEMIVKAARVDKEIQDQMKRVEKRNKERKQRGKTVHVEKSKHRQAKNQRKVKKQRKTNRRYQSTMTMHFC